MSSRGYLVLQNRQGETYCHSVQTDKKIFGKIVAHLIDKPEHEDWKMVKKKFNLMIQLQKMILSLKMMLMRSYG